MSNVPTAEDYLKIDNAFSEEDVYLLKQDLKINNILDIDDISTTMIEFAKLHVIAALKSRDELYETYYSDEINFTHDNKDFIKKAYPLENIK